MVNLKKLNNPGNLFFRPCLLPYGWDSYYEFQDSLIVNITRSKRIFWKMMRLHNNIFVNYIFGLNFSRSSLLVTALLFFEKMYVLLSYTFLSRI